jgi:hypothetical protein
MDARTAWGWLEQLLGAAIITITLVDVFYTVLHARSHIGPISDRVSRLTWHSFAWVGARLSDKQRGHFLTYMGPVILLLIAIIWILALTFGSALVIHPHLGEGFKALHTPTPTDFITALVAGSHSIVVFGDNNIAPETSGARLYIIFTSTAGLIVTTLTLTYILHVYTGLQNRDVLGLELHLLTDETGDAAELLAGLGAHGHLSDSFSELSQVASQIVAVEESYHHYPVLFFYRFSEPYYSVSSITLVALDAVTLIKSALDDEEYAWLKESAAVAQLRRAATRLTKTLMNAFLDGPPDPPAAIDPAAAERWRRRYQAAVRCLQQASINTVADEEEGARAYIALRAEWDYLIAYLAPSLGYSMAEIDPAGQDPEQPDRRDEFAARLRSGE